MENRKEKELQKYLEKKKKQHLRDELFYQLSQISKVPEKQTVNLIKTKVKKRKAAKDASRFEEKLFETEVNIENETSSYVEYVDPKDNVAGIKNSEITNDNEAVLNDLVDESTLTKNSEQITTLINEVSASECNQENESVKQAILNLNEEFEIQRCKNRDPKIQEQRMKLEVFYEETEIVSQIKYSLITFVQGETGCGKTTQVPQFLYENGFTKTGKICVTQPRRFSAVSIASRINEEMGENLAGYKIKYENTITENTQIKVVTEGVLFKEIQSDFTLSEYSVVILDEVHERSAISDILVGLLSRIVKIRFEMKKPLRLVLMSATVDPSIYKPVLGAFNLIELKGRMHKVSVFYEIKTEENYVEACFNKIVGIMNSEKTFCYNKKSKGKSADVPVEVSNDFKSSILVFLPSKDDIYLLKSKLEDFSTDIVALPLHSSLSKSEQKRVYETYPKRKIVLSTNIAETSVTIDDIVFVIDSCRVKIKIMDQSSVIYKIAFINKSSAKQRMGRAGRTKPGVCYRMISGDTFETLDDQNIPQILIEPFESNFLQLKSMGIKNIFAFPFINSPSEDTIKETVESLTNLGMLDKKGNITSLGLSTVKLPLSPRYAKMIIQSQHLENVIFEKILAIAAILSSGIEFKRNDFTNEFYESSKSDLLVGLKIFIGFLKAADRKKYCKSLGMSFEALDEVKKLSKYLMKLTRKEGVDNFNTEIDEESENLLCKVLFYTFADQMAVCMGDSYIYKDGDLFISSNSVNAENKNIVFDYIVCGSNRSWAKNITVISPEWFK